MYDRDTSTAALQAQKVRNETDRPLSFLVMRHMAGILQRHPLHLRDVLEEGDLDELLCYIFAAMQYQRWDLDEMQPVHDRPVVENPRGTQRSARSFLL